MAALVFVLMVPVFVGVLVGMPPRLVSVLVPLMAVGASFVAMLMLMLVFAVAAHSGRTSFS
jgi:ABC-type anion transport system duplicated permease subunit